MILDVNVHAYDGSGSHEVSYYSSCQTKSPLGMTMRSATSSTTREGMISPHVH
ncbi:unnamed protein product [Penicillium camemberti]|uniref:Str. FM013 n=1 Tax=Penicillium camemberti (strain FM 013) TaxID=1429867 RepID=A0A0G4PDU5_PENC3|nr:unnamed protein product [Penicillium camemberti]